jgi:hypothetical protein
MEKPTAFFDKAIFGRYRLGAAYDESFAGPGVPRPNYEALYRHLLELPDDELMHRQSAADLSFLQQGITFMVYAEEQGTERIFSYDLLPRLITHAEWHTIERGLTQRITALNLFLHDIYHDGKILKDGVLPRDLIYSSKHYRREMRGLAVPRNAYVAIAGTDLVRVDDAQTPGAGGGPSPRSPGRPAHHAARAQQSRLRRLRLHAAEHPRWINQGQPRNNSASVCG